MSAQVIPAADRAKALMELGYSVVLLHGRDADGVCLCPQKKECEHFGPHPLLQRKAPLKPKSASQAQEWWQARPACRIGVVTSTDLVVFICDGAEQIRQLSRYGDLGQGLAIHGSSRKAYLFRAVGQIPSKGCVAAIQGADFYGNGDWIPEPLNLNVPITSLPTLPPSLEILLRPHVARPGIMDFPLDVFPVALREFVEQVSKSIQCSPTITAGNVLAVAAGAIGSGRSIEIKSDWVARSSIFCAIVAPPGTGKTPAGRYAKAPIEEIQAAWSDTYVANSRAYKISCRKHMLLHAHWEEQFRKYLRGEASDPGEPPELPLPPEQQQIFSTDATSEAVVQMLKVNNGSLLCWHDELRSWMATNDRELWLELWSSATTVVNRKTFNQPVSIRSPVVSVVGNLPTDLLKKLGSTLQQSDGFVDRILFCVASDARDDEPGCYTVSHQVLEKYASVIHHLAALRHDQCEDRHLEINSDARKVFFDWVYRHRRETKHQSIPPILRGMFAKLDEYCARFCLILHLIRIAEDNSIDAAVDVESVQRAIRLTTFFKHQARFALQMMVPRQQVTRIENALKWIQRKGVIVSARDIQRNNVAGVRSSEETSALLTLLESYGFGTIVRGSNYRILFSLKEKFVGHELTDLGPMHSWEDIRTWIKHK